MIVSAVFILFYTCFGLHQHPSDQGSLAAKVFVNCVHQVVAGFVYARSTVYSAFFTENSWQLLETTLMRVVRENQNTEVTGCKTKMHQKKLQCWK